MSESRLFDVSTISEEEIGESMVYANVRNYDPMFYRLVGASECMEATITFLYLYKRMRVQEYVVVMEEKMKTLLKFYRRNKNLLNRLLVDRVIKTELCNLCYTNQIEDSDIVVQCLKSVHEVFIMPHVNVLFYILWHFTGNLPNVSPVIREDKIRRNKKIYPFIAYFLHHARMKRLMFRGCRITDIMWEPVDYNILRSGIMSNSLLTYDYEIIQLLHQYGANFTGRIANVFGPLPPVFFGEFGRILFGFQSTDLWDLETLELLVDPENINVVTKTMLNNFCIFVMSTTNPCVTTFNLAGAPFRRWNIPTSDVLVPFYDTFFPEFELGRNQPCCLQHTTRHIIRSVLNANWQLPDGIWRLGLPNPLCSYLNFEDYSRL